MKHGACIGVHFALSPFERDEQQKLHRKRDYFVSKCCRFCGYFSKFICGASPNTSSCPDPIYYVLKYTNDACPPGATPVYRLFHRGSIPHRYTQSAATYSELQDDGFIGAGPVFCAPTHE